MELNLLVLRAEEPETLISFYEALGLTFIREQHDAGPLHFSCRAGEALLEIYPAGKSATTNIRIGFLVDDVAQSCEATKRMGGVVRTCHLTGVIPCAVIEDPAGHKIELTQRPHLRE